MLPLVQISFVIAFARADFAFIPAPKSQATSPANFGPEGNVDSLDARPSMICERMRQNIGVKSVTAANRRPIEFIYPYARLQAMAYFWSLHLILTKLDFELANFENLRSERLQDQRAELRDIASELTATHGCPSRCSDFRSTN